MSGTNRIASALFSPVQQRILGLLFGQPRRRFQSAELIRLAQGGTGGVHRVLMRLTDAGLVIATRAGNQKYYQANDSNPVFPELCGIIAKTVGLAEPLYLALRPYARQIIAAFLFGPVGKKLETTHGDLEVVVISDDVDYPDVIIGLGSAEEALGRPVVPIIMSSAEWRATRDVPGTFAARVARQPRLFLIGSENALGTI